MSKNSRNGDFKFMSFGFADSIIKMQPHIQHKSDYQQLYVKQEPLIMAGPTLGLDKDDDDEACEIGSDDSDDEDVEDDQSDVNRTQNSKTQDSKLQDSMRSSRTATFKSLKLGTNNNVNPTAESYYAFSGLHTGHSFSKIPVV